MINKEILKKQIIYRSNHRGIKEMDLLLGKFVKIHINKLENKDLQDLMNLLLLEDEVIQKWYFEKKSNSVISIYLYTLFAILIAIVRSQFRHNISTRKNNRIRNISLFSSYFF